MKNNNKEEKMTSFSGKEMIPDKRCSRCLLPGSLKSIQFDNDGVCNYCKEYEKNFSNWTSIKEKKRQEFEEIVEYAKKLNRPYDCIIPLSGGKDSTFVLYLCSKVYELKCLAVTFNNGFLSNPAKENITNALKSTNVDHFFYHMNRSNSIKLYKSFLLKTGQFCKACMRGINYSIESALKISNAPLVIKGSGRRVEYISQISDVSSLHTPSFIDNVFKDEDANFKKGISHFVSDKFRLEFQKALGAICQIVRIPRTKIMRFIPQHIEFYDYIYYPYPEIVEIIKRDMGWSDSKGSIEHLDCELHEIPFFIQTLKLPGITTATFRNSGLIRQGIITRSEGLEIENQKMKNIAPPRELGVFLKEINMGYEEFEKHVRTADTYKYEPKLQKKLRKIYYKLRKI